MTITLRNHQRFTPKTQPSAGNAPNFNIDTTTTGRTRAAISARTNSAWCASHEHDDLWRRGSAMQAPRGYADGAGRCSNRKALPDCVTSQPRQLPPYKAEQQSRAEIDCSTRSLGIFMRMSYGAQYPICGARLLPTVRSAGVEMRKHAALPPLSSRRVRPNLAPLGGRP